MPLASLPRRAILKLAALSLALGAVAGPPALAQQAKPEVIRIGSTAPGHLKFILFRNQKLLEKEFGPDGIRIELTTFDGGSAASVALGSGAIDVTGRIRRRPAATTSDGRLPRHAGDGA